MEKDLIIKSRLINLLNKESSIEIDELLSADDYKKYEILKPQTENESGDKDDELFIEKIEKEKDQIDKIIKDLKEKRVFSVQECYGNKKIQEDIYFKNFKEGFYTKLILNEFCVNYEMGLLNHKNTSLGEVNENDLEIFYCMGKMLIEEGIIKGSNNKPFEKTNLFWEGLVKPSLSVMNSKLKRIMLSDELNVILKIEEEMSRNNNSQTNISIEGNNNNISNGNNNSQIITINEAELIQSLVDSIKEIKDDNNSEDMNEMLKILEELKESDDKESRWEKFLSLTNKAGENTNTILKLIASYLANVG